MVDQVLSRVAKPDRMILSDYEPMLWNDIALERTAELIDGITGFLTRIDQQIDLGIAQPGDAAGTVAEPPYRRKGARTPDGASGASSE